MKIILRKLTPVNEGEELLLDILITNGENEEARSMTVFSELFSELGYPLYTEKGGKMLSKEEFTALEYAEKQTAAIRKGIELLAFAPNTKKGLGKKLLMRGHAKEFAEYACEKLCELGYIDEISQAEFLTTELAGKKLYGPMRIKKELYAKGFCPDAISSALECEIDFDEICAKRIEKTVGAEAFTERESRNKAMAALSRYGFTSDNIRSALNHKR